MGDVGHSSERWKLGISCKLTITARWIVKVPADGINIESSSLLRNNPEIVSVQVDWMGNSAQLVRLLLEREGDVGYLPESGIIFDHPNCPHITGRGRLGSCQFKIHHQSGWDIYIESLDIIVRGPDGLIIEDFESRWICPVELQRAAV